MASGNKSEEATSSLDKLVNGTLLRGLSLFSNKMAIAPGFHLLFSAMAFTASTSVGKFAMDFLTGKMDDKTLERVKAITGYQDGSNHPLKAVFEQFGSLRYDENVHAPLVENWDKLIADGKTSKGKLKEQSSNEWKKVAHTYAPLILGFYATLKASQYFEDGYKHTHDTVNKLPDNTLGAQRKIMLEQGDIFGPLSAALLNTGVGSFRIFSGPAQTLLRFGPMTGQNNSLPGVSDLIHGNGRVGMENHEAGIIIVEKIVKFLASKEADNYNLDEPKSYLHRAVDDVLKQFWKKGEHYNDKTVDGIVRNLVRVREELIAGGKSPGGQELLKELGKEIKFGWDKFIGQVAPELDLADANIEGGGALSMLAKAVGKLGAGSKRIEEIKNRFEQEAMRTKSAVQTV